MLGEDSLVQNVTFNNIKTNAISFGGFEEKSATVAGSGNFVINDVHVSSSVFESPDSLMRTKKYSYVGLSKFIIQASSFKNLEFKKFGNIFSLTHNAKQAIELKGVTFEAIFGAGIRLEPQDIFDKANPLTLSIADSFFKNNTPYVSGFIDVYENSIVQI